MPIVSSEIKKTVAKHNGNRAIYEQHTDHLGVVHPHRYQCPPVGEFDEVAALAANALLEEAALPTDEALADAGRYKTGSAERAPDHQLQADYDRRVLRELMQEEDALAFANALTFFRSFEIRGGANAAQRASYLGVPKSEYDLVATRYNQITGVENVLNEDAARVWRLDSHEGWE